MRLLVNFYIYFYRVANTPPVETQVYDPISTNTTPAEGLKTVNKRKRRKPMGAKALREIAKYQQSTAPCMSKRPFYRLVREISQECSSVHDFHTGLRFTSDSLELLQVNLTVFLYRIKM